jgi:protein-ribulosamine 3-kinase
MSIWTDIGSVIARETSTRFEITRQRPVGGGCINKAYVVEGMGQSYFVKINARDRLPMFQAEIAGLLELAEGKAVRVPRPLCAATAGQSSFIAMEYIAFGTGDHMAAFGRQLADLHRRSAAHFGWHMNNTLGESAQINSPSKDWCEFWRAYRLGHQLALAARNSHGGALQSKGARLMAHLDEVLADHRPQPSLVHGDLWCGNVAMGVDGAAVIFDPAVYYGDRETDLAMTELFGGFGEEFYCAYHEAYPLDSGYTVRKTLYNLYHVLNHLNLFGGAYAAQAERMMDSLLGELDD